MDTFAEEDPELYDSLLQAQQEHREGTLVPVEIACQEVREMLTAYRLLKEQFKTSA